MNENDDLEEIKISKKITSLSLEEESSEKYLKESGLSFKLIEKLYDYQRFGVEWLIKKFYSNLGGAILADDMGLGKTIQVLCFLNCLYQQHKIRTILIILPKSLIENWISEIRTWLPNVYFLIYEGTKKQRQQKLSNIQHSCGILITTYGMVCKNWEQLAESVYSYNKPFKWDCVILDESHKIRNATKTTRGINKIEAKFRLAITGTPLQNNLMEMYNLLNFVTNKRSIFGGKDAFENEFSNLITQGLFKDVSQIKKTLGLNKLNELQNLIAPFILRRSKKEQCAELTSKNSQLNISKTDLIVWISMTDYQLQVYKTFLQSDEVREAIKNLKCGKSVALVKLSVLRKIPNHPFLTKNYNFMEHMYHSLICLLKEAQSTLNMDDPNDESKDMSFLRQLSCKLNFTLKLLKEILIPSEKNHKVIVFSQSTKLLDYLANAINSHLNVQILQFDGRTNSISSRQEIVRKFQEEFEYKILLASIQVGGVGLNLTAADRIIILEPSWNPGNEYQAIDRACRIGQKSQVIVYRLITCGTIEEKMYRKQVFKDSIVKHVIDNQKDLLRYFSWLDLTELFKLGDPFYSLTHAELSNIHNSAPKDPIFEEQKLLLHRSGAHGVTNNGLLYEHINKNTNIFNKNVENKNLTDLDSTLELLDRIDNVENIESFIGDDAEHMILSSTRLSSTVTSNLSNNNISAVGKILNSTSINHTHLSVDHNACTETNENMFNANKSVNDQILIKRRKNRFLEDSSDNSTTSDSTQRNNSSKSLPDSDVQHSNFQQDFHKSIEPNSLTGFYEDKSCDYKNNTESPINLEIPPLIFHSDNPIHSSTIHNQSSCAENSLAHLSGIYKPSFINSSTIVDQQSNLDENTLNFSNTSKDEKINFESMHGDKNNDVHHDFGEEDEPFDSKLDRENLKELVQSFSQHMELDNGSKINTIIIENSDVFVSCIDDEGSISIMDNEIKRCIKCSTRMELVEFINPPRECVCRVSDSLKTRYYKQVRKAHAFEIGGNLMGALNCYLKVVQISDSDLSIVFAIKRIYEKITNKELFLIR